MKLVTITLVICLLPVAFSLTLTEKSFTSCNAFGKIQSVDVEPCSAEPCTVKNGDNVKIATKFISIHDTNECYLKASLLISGGWFEILHEPACGGDVECPLITGQTYTLEKTLGVTDKLPKGIQTTKWKLECNNAADEIFCGDVLLNVA